MELIEKLDLEWLLNICAIFFIFAVYISIAAFRLDAKHKKEKANKGEFDHAIKQMSDPAIVSKLAGIDTLKRIALESPKEYLPILMDILTAFIKDMSPLSISASQPDLKTLPEEIQATLNVIGKHKNRYKKKSNINLSEVYLPRACMEGFDLRNINFEGSVLLDAKMKGSKLTKTNLTDADLRWADLSETDLQNAILQDTKYNDGTIFPNGFVPSEHGMIKWNEKI